MAIFHRATRCVPGVSRQCIAKKKYPDERQAKSWVKLVWKKYRKRVRYYECEHCDGFHLTSKLEAY